MHTSKIITRTVLLLSLVSLFNDISSEMLYPVMPLFLQSIGFTTVLIGVLEGFAEAVAGLSKMYFGRLSDEMGRRMPFVRWGYLLSAFSKPMIALFTSAAWIFSARTLDRLGKGIRTAARDAVLSSETTAQHKGTVFGFHRALDTVGATIGPLIALLYLQFYPEAYKSLFLLAFIPAIAGVALTLFVKEKRYIAAKAKDVSFVNKLFYWKQSPVAFRQLMVGLLFFGMMNSSDIFLLLRAKEVTNDDATVLSSYILYNLVYALFAFPLGRLADRIGMRRMLVSGLILFVAVYAGMSFANNTAIIVSLLFLYGIYAAASEGIAKAYISNLVPPDETASAIGFYTGWNSIAMLIASSVTGWIWYKFSPESAFMLSAIGTLIAAVYLAMRK